MKFTLILFTTGALILGCSQVLQGHSDDAHLRALSFVQKELGILATSPVLVLKPIAFRQLACTAFNVEIRDQTPSYSLVLLDGREGTVPSLVNKTLVRDWKGAVEAALIDIKVHSVDPAVLAADLTKVLVDPNDSYGRVISSREEIPWELEQSARYRYLRKQNLSDGDLKSRALENLPSEQPLGPPFISEEDRQIMIIFYTWGYFGGEVIRWQISLTETLNTSSMEIVAVEVGSYDFYL